MDNHLSQEEIELLMEGGMIDEGKDKKSEKNSLEENKETINEDEKITNEEVIKGTSDNKKVKTRKKAKEKKPSFISNIKDKFKSSKKQKVTNPDVSENQTDTVSVKNNKLLKSINNAPTNALFIAIIVLVVLVVIMSVLLFIQVSKKNKLDMVGKTTVSVPKYKPNTTNYIYISQKKTFKDEPLELVKILIDPIATLFYFDRPLDFMMSEASLKDKNGKVYNMDISFAEAANIDETASAIIRFEPIDNNVNEFTLSISDPYTNNSAEYTIVLDSYPEFIPPKYLSNTIKTEDSNGDMQVTVEEALFSSSGSVIEYSLHWKDDVETIQSGWKDISPSELVSLEERSSIVSSSKNYPTMYSFPNDNIILGRMDFNAVKDLNSNVDIIFKNLYKYKAIDKNIDLTGMPYYVEQDKEKYINIDNYKIVLERFADFGENCILVYHVEDLLKSSGDNRVETRLEGKLVISDGSGLEVILDGKCQAKQEGAQLTFDTKNSQEIINQLKNKQYQLSLKSAGIKFPNQKVSLDLSKLNDTTRQMDKKEVEDFVIEGFEKRLGVKSGEVEVNELNNYFESYILKEDAIVRDYLNPDTLIQPAEYSSQVLTTGKNDNGMYYVVVQDSWKGDGGVKEVHFYRTHKVVVQKTGDKWIITEDNILK